MSAVIQSAVPAAVAKPTGKLESIQMGRAIAVMMVVFYHLLTLSREYQHGRFAAPWMEILAGGVDVFFVISGIVMVLTTWNRLEKKGTASRFMVHRISRIYPPYLTLTILLTPIWLKYPNKINASHGGVSLLGSYTLIPTGKLPLVGVAWSLSYEMMFYLIFFVILCFVKRAYLRASLLTWGGAVVTAALIRLAVPTETIRSLPAIGQFLLKPFPVEFIAGCLLALAFLKGPLRWWRQAIVASLVGFVAVGIVLQVSPTANELVIERPDFRILLYALPSVLLVYGLLQMGREKAAARIPRLAVLCGDASYSIYMVHILVIHAAYRLVRHMPGPGAKIAFLAGTLAVALGSSIVFYRLVEKPFSRWARQGLEKIFSGARSPREPEAARVVVMAEPQAEMSAPGS